MTAPARTRKVGLVLGKFMPPHLGHLHLIDFAEGYCDELVVVVGTLAKEPIPRDLRFAWMQELCAGKGSVRVVHLTDENPQDPSEHPDFWNIWKTSLERVLDASGLPRPTHVFASEAYGKKLAEVLGHAAFIPVDPSREGVPISGTAIRDDPMRHWELIPRCVRPYFVKRVCIFGPESTGKSTLTKQLAAAFHTIAVPEYARTYLEAYPVDEEHPVDAAAMDVIARGQIASEDALARSANRVLFCDTDTLTNTVWNDVLIGPGSSPAWMLEEAARRRYDLTLLTDVDIPWVQDPVRFRPDDRRSFFDRCEAALNAANRRYVVIHGLGQERFERAKQAVTDALFASPGASDKGLSPDRAIDR